MIDTTIGFQDSYMATVLHAMQYFITVDTRLPGMNEATQARKCGLGCWAGHFANLEEKIAKKTIEVADLTLLSVLHFHVPTALKERSKQIVRDADEVMKRADGGSGSSPSNPNPKKRCSAKQQEEAKSAKKQKKDSGKRIATELFAAKKRAVAN